MQNRINTKRLIMVLAGVVFLAAILASGLWIYERKPVSGMGKENGLVIAEETSDWNKPLENRSGSEQGIKIPGYGELTINRDAKTFQMSLVNPEDNPCYFKYSLEIASTSEVIYESDLIEPGKAIREFQVQNLPEAGEYDLHIHISTYTMDGNLTAMNGAQIKTILHVV